MTGLCQPTPELRAKVWCHHVLSDGVEWTLLWDGSLWHDGLSRLDPERAALVGYRYVGPVATHAQVGALRAALQAATGEAGAVRLAADEVRTIAQSWAKDAIERDALRGLLAALLALPMAKEALRALDRGMGTATENAAWLRARAAAQEPWA